MGRVRVATFADTKAIVDFLESYHRTSNLSDIEFNRLSMSTAVDYHIGTKKHIAYVYDSDGKIEGIIMGGIEPFMFNQKRTWASDTLFIATRGGASLIKRFHAWSRAHKVDRIIHGVSSGNRAADELYKAIGMNETGGMYVLH